LDSGIEGHPRNEGEGTACYLLRLFTEGITGFDGLDAFAHSTAQFVQPAIGETVEVFLDNTAPFFADEYIWIGGGGFYQVVSVNGETNSIVVTNLFGPPNNISEDAIVLTNALIVVSGAPGLPGEPGDVGATGAAGASGATGPTGGTGPTGPAGATGPASAEVDQTWTFISPGDHTFLCPAGVIGVRVRVYGAGGGGGGGASAGNGSGPGFGGGGGEYADRFVTVIPGNTYTAHVGAGGAGGTGGDDTAIGGNGGASDFHDIGTTYIQGNGGTGGGAGTGLDMDVGPGGTGGTGTANLRLPGFPGILLEGGLSGRIGTGGLGDTAGTPYGGGGGAGSGDGGGPMTGGPGGAGGVGAVVIEVTDTL